MALPLAGSRSQVRLLGHRPGGLSESLRLWEGDEVGIESKGDIAPAREG